MDNIPLKIQQIRSQIRSSETAFGRKSGSVQLLAVSKNKPVESIVVAYQNGVRHFAESYVQEASLKQKALAGFAISWHFIGPIQANKTRVIARGFDWVHSVDRLKIARRLSEQRPECMAALNICLQVNISKEATKSGMSLDELPYLIEDIAGLPNIRLRGVMAIPEPASDPDRQRLPYRELFDYIRRLDKPGLDTFSFGMSGDFPAAIAEGSTIVRIGTAIFGSRHRA